MASRAPTTVTGTTSSLSRSPADVKPSDVYELKLRTQQILQKSRQLRTQVNRLNDKISSHTNAINRTFEKQSDQPISGSHKNTVNQLSRSVTAAENTLSNLRKEIDRVRYDDKTFLVSELREEVKLAYCENQRLSKELQDRSAEASNTEKLLSEASKKASNQNINEVKRDIRDLQNAIKQLREKSIAYRTKKGKLQVERQINDNINKKVDQRRIAEDANQQQEEKTQLINENAEELKNSKKEFEEKYAELQDIYEMQRQKITDFLAGRTHEDDENDDDDQDEHRNDDSEHSHHDSDDD